MTILHLNLECPVCGKLFDVPMKVGENLPHIECHCSIVWLATKTTPRLVGLWEEPAPKQQGPVTYP